MRLNLTVIFAFLVISIQTPVFANLSQLETQQAVQRARAWVQKEGWLRGIEFLQETLLTCGQDESGKNCRSLINYTLGYMWERQARAEADLRTERLMEAVESYRRVLTEVPNHGPTLHNLALAYKQLGKRENALGLLNQAIDSDPSRRGLYATAIGDIYYDQSQWDKALHIYLRAAKWNPRAEEPPLRIVDVYRNLSVSRLGELTELLVSWQGTFPDAAERGYRLIMKAALTDNHRERAEQALLSRISLLARNRRLTLQRASALYSDWKTPAIEQLLDYIQNPRDAYADMNWWRSGFRRRHVLAEAALAVGHLDLKLTGPKAAEARWQEAIHQISPELYHYFGSNLPLVRLELQTELAALYYQYPELDPDNNKFTRLIWGIFRSKGDAYEMNDLKAIQSHHTVLGFIYAREPKRESIDHRATNAVFQLHHAVKTANKRFDNREPYQPLPQLKEMLADSCHYPSKAAQRRSIKLCTNDGRKPLGNLYLEAAQAYLDTDQLKKTALMLARARDSHLNTGGLRTYEDLSQIAATRVSIEKITPENSAAVVNGLVSSQASTGWITNDQLTTLSQNFVLRQRFKTTSDLAFKLEDFSKADASISPSLAMIKPIISSASKSLVLSGTADQLRVKRLETMGIRPTSARDCPPKAELEDMRWVQRSLNKILSAELVVDGRYGQSTRQVIREFQEKFGLQVDGKAGTQTKNKIRELLCE